MFKAIHLLLTLSPEPKSSLILVSTLDVWLLRFVGGVFVVCFFFCHHYALDLKCKQKYKLHVYYVETYLEGLIERMDISVFLIIPIQCFPASYVSLLQVFSKGCSPYVSPAFSQVRS